MLRPSRYIAALLLTAVYAVIIMSQLAPFAMHSPTVAHAVTGECSGDCRICGCSPEHSANHTCCCWLKKQKDEEQKHEAEAPAFCKKKRAAKATVTITCGCPCGSGKQLAIAGFGGSELVPFQFDGFVVKPYIITRDLPRVRRLTDRHCDPTDPPPKLSHIS